MNVKPFYSSKNRFLKNSITMGFLLGFFSSYYLMLDLFDIGFYAVVAFGIDQGLRYILK